MPETDRPLTPEERQEAERLCAEMPMGPMEPYVRRVIRRALATIAAMEQARATAYAEGLDDAIAAVRRVKGATLPDAYSEDPDVIHMSYAVIAIEALRDTPAPAPTGEEKP